MFICIIHVIPSNIARKTDTERRPTPLRHPAELIYAVTIAYILKKTT